jgi:hypothetical protein
MFIKISKVKNEDGSVEFYFYTLENEKYYEPLLKIMTEEKKATIIKKIDMITDWDTILVLHNKEFLWRHHYFYGNYLYTSNPDNSDFLEELANWLAEYLNDKIRKNMKQ